MMAAAALLVGNGTGVELAGRPANATVAAGHLNTDGSEAADTEASSDELPAGTGPEASARWLLLGGAAERSAGHCTSAAAGTAAVAKVGMDGSMGAALLSFRRLAAVGPVSALSVMGGKAAGTCAATEAAGGAAGRAAVSPALFCASGAAVAEARCSTAEALNGASSMIDCGLPN